MALITLTFDERAWRLVPWPPTKEMVEMLKQLMDVDDIESALSDVISAAPQPEPVEPLKLSVDVDGIVAAAVRAENEACAVWLETFVSKPQEIRLHAGELIGSELRAVQAVLRFAAIAIRARQEGK